MLTKTVTGCLAITLMQVATAFAASWDCEVLPSEQKVVTDEQSGAKVVFVTTNTAADTNFYFHKRCFLWNNRFMLFNSDRFGRGEVMGCLLDTGELVRLVPAQEPAPGSMVASVKGDRIYLFKNDAIYVWKLEVVLQPKTSVRITETKVMDMPEETRQRSFLEENCDGSLLAFGYKKGDTDFLGFCELASGKILPPAQLEFKPDHFQFHPSRPDLLSFCCVYESDMAPMDPKEPAHCRFWFMNVHTRVPLPAFYQVPGEIVTHECWWVNDQMTFIGGHHHDGSREEGNVKVYDLKTGDIRIIGAGAWVEGASAEELSKVNWWHASGSPDGKWVAADNWHGIVALFNAKTTEKKVLTTGHRTYGGGQHLHVGWDLTGSRLEFSSNKLGNLDVCLAYVPEGW